MRANITPNRNSRAGLSTLNSGPIADYGSHMKQISYEQH